MKKGLLNIKDFVHINLSRGERSEVLTEDLINAEKKVDLIRQTFQNAEKKISACLQTPGSGTDTASKEKRLKKLPTTQLYQCLAEHADQLGTDSVFGHTLAECCKLQSALAKEMLNNEVEIEEHCLNVLKNVVEIDIPSVNKSRKHLNKATSDMDAHKIRYQTALKQIQQNVVSISKVDSLKKELEEATLKVDQSRDFFATEMFSLLSREPEFAEIFVNLFRLQANYYRKMNEIFENYLPDLENVIENTRQKPVFGTSLEEHLRVTRREVSIVIETCIGWLLNYLHEEGLFRIPGSASKVRKLKSAFDAGLVEPDEYAKDPHTIAGALKSYLRELPEHLFTYALYPEWINAARIGDSDTRLQELWKIIKKLPKANFDNLKYLIKFLTKLSSCSEYNKMSSQNLAIAIAPSLIWAPQTEGQFDMNMTTANIHSVIVDSLINYCDWFFPGELNFVTLTISDKLTNGENSDIHQNTQFSTKTLVQRPAKKHAAPAPPQASTKAPICVEEEDNEISSSPEVCNLIPTDNDPICSSSANFIFSTGSLDRNKPKNDTDKTKHSMNDKKPISRHKSIEKPSVPPPSVPSRSDRPTSMCDKPLVLPPERPQRACDNKAKQRSLDNLSEIDTAEDSLINLKLASEPEPIRMYPNLEDLTTIDTCSDNSDSLIVTVVDENVQKDNSSDSVLLVSNDESSNDALMFEDSSDGEVVLSNENINQNKADLICDVPSDQQPFPRPNKPPRTSSPGSTSTGFSAENCLKNKTSEPALCNEDFVDNNVNVATSKQQRPPRPQPPANKPRVNSVGEKTYL